MTDKEIIQVLRICATHIEKGCGLCQQMKYVRCTERLADEAITMIERLTAERDALLEYAKTMQECEMCKNDSFCHFREPMEDDCQHCQRASDCPCQKCEENNCWEWRGLPEAPEEKHESV